MYTIGRLARKFKLSRSTLLYYDSIGLLKPAGRSKGEYRRYSEEDAGRLERVCLYRRAGVPLKDIMKLLDNPWERGTSVLEDRLEYLNEQIKKLRDQQRLIVELLQDGRALERIAPMNRTAWVALLSASGFSEEDMLRWHVAFESRSPGKHREFLEFLCIPDKEIAAIRSWAATGAASRKRGVLPRPNG
jgi:DNA-binding transcriptional MerR regulator